MARELSKQTRGSMLKLIEQLDTLPHTEKVDFFRTNMDVSWSAVRRWIRSWQDGDFHVGPQSYAWLRVMHRLYALGFAVPEVMHMESAVLRLGRAVGFGRLNHEHVADAINVSQTHLIRVLKGEGNPSEEMYAGITKFLQFEDSTIGSDFSRWELEFKEQSELLAESYNFYSLNEDEPEPETEKESRPARVVIPNRVTIQSTTSASKLTHDMLLTQLVHTLSGVGPLLEYALDHSTPDERERIRRSLGSSTIFELSTRFNRLCSESARAQ